MSAFHSLSKITSCAAIWNKCSLKDCLDLKSESTKAVGFIYKQYCQYILRLCFSGSLFSRSLKLGRTFYWYKPSNRIQDSTECYQGRASISSIGCLRLLWSGLKVQKNGILDHFYKMNLYQFTYELRNILRVNTENTMNNKEQNIP